MRNLLFFLALLFYKTSFGQASFTKFENNQSNSYEEALSLYRGLSKKFPKSSKLLEYGTTDAGYPLHLFVISFSGDFNPESLKLKNKSILLINNGIHAGEPCGIDASLLLARDLLEDKQKQKALENTVICFIPLYNIGGSQNRGCCSRVNQNGPEEYGFRGNARNLDLNRDFIKCDSEDAKTFTRIYHQWNPDIFVDTHSTNGADYPYVMTLISSQKDKQAKALADFTTHKMLPFLYQQMGQKKFPMAPYVYSVKETPESGLIGFLETPRYSTGFTNLFNTFSFVTEAHMLKPYQERVLATYAFISSLLDFTSENSEAIKEARAKANKEVLAQQYFPLTWELDTNNYSLLPFNGYPAKYKTSVVTGQQRLYYDSGDPYHKEIRYFNNYNQGISVEKPRFYLLHPAWKEAVERLQLNGVIMRNLEKDTIIEAEVYYIQNQKTLSQPFEGHYLHYNIEVTQKTEKVEAKKGTYIIPVDQPAIRYIIETLEPQAVDGFFAWNFFDEILQQKEYFSPYLFEEVAKQLLDENPGLRSELEDKQEKDEAFRANAYAQLNFIYQNSKHFEKSYKRFPVYRVK
jgi:hypothetical protein